MCLPQTTVPPSESSSNMLNTRVVCLSVPRRALPPHTSLRAMASANKQNGDGQVEGAVHGEAKGQGVTGALGNAAANALTGTAKAVKSTTGIVGAPTIKTNTKQLTDNEGVPQLSNTWSMRAGRQGPQLQEDTWFQEKLGQFNREKIPERVVHARGAGAKGIFEVEHDVSHLTHAHFLNGIGTKTEVVVRLSTVTHEKGSPESLRDVRGFSVKFYTQEGNHHFVGNNIPVFFIRDGMQFPDLVHSLRPNPKTHIQEGWRALDFLQYHPESTNILTWLLGPEGIPANWRVLEGHSVNTYTFINAEGKERLCKMHFFPEGGAKYLTNQEAQQVGKNNVRHSHATKDLFDAIGAQDYPRWSFEVQVLEEGDEAKLGFSPLDNTKEWPYDVIPLQKIGTLTLNENVANFNNDVEVAAYDPGRMVPGIGASDDPVLQSRLHSYADTQRYRLGVNYTLLPVNQPRCPFHLNNNDGAMNMTEKDEEVNYFPSSVEHQGEHEATGYSLRQAPIQGSQRARVDFADYGGTDVDFQQAGDRIRGFTPEQRSILLENLTEWMTHPKCTQSIKDAWYGHWSRADAGFGAELKAEVEKSKQPESGLYTMAGAA